MEQSLTLIAATEHDAQAATAAQAAQVLVLTNDADPHAPSLEGVERIDLHFPKFSDGRAYSQAFLLRRRRGFTGEIRATGDVLVDQLVQMQRTGFSSAVLRADQKLDYVQAQFERFLRYYQGDAVAVAPLFKEPASAAPSRLKQASTPQGGSEGHEVPSAGVVQ